MNIACQRANQRLNRPQMALSCLMLTLCLAACAATNSGPGAALPAPVVTSVSRVVIPANGGQTILVPRLMSDAISLWSPLNARERRRAVAQAKVDADLTGYDVASWLPSTEYDTMQRYLYRLTHDQKELTGRVLARAESYMPIVLAGVRNQGLPVELACLPLVESAFEPQAVSPAGAAGLWQLMPETARGLGLQVTADMDERFDVRKSTEAATAYLAYLYRLFGDWPLAIAAYNCGEGAMQKAMARANCTTLDGLTAYCRLQDPDARLLKEETLRFVPQFTAAVMVMSGSERLGLASGHALREPSTAAGAANKGSTGKLALTGRYDSAAQPASVPPRSTRLP